MTNDQITFGDVLLVEYEQLKKEQITRIRFRDNLLYATLVTAAALAAAALSDKGPVSLLLALPPVSVVLGWTYVSNNEKVSSMGAYIRAEIAPQLATLTGETPVLRWETANRSDPRRRTRKVFQLTVDLTAFCLAPLAALTLVHVHTSATPALVTISVLEVLAVLALAGQIIAYSDLR